MQKSGRQYLVGISMESIQQRWHRVKLTYNSVGLLGSRSVSRHTWARQLCWVPPCGRVAKHNPSTFFYILRYVVDVYLRVFCLSASQIHDDMARKASAHHSWLSRQWISRSDTPHSSWNVDQHVIAWLPFQVLDYLAIGVHELASISERRIERLVNPSLSELPAFLVQEGGLNSGFMIAHCTAAALGSSLLFNCLLFNCLHHF